MNLTWIQSIQLCDFAPPNTSASLQTQNEQFDLARFGLPDKYEKEKWERELIVCSGV